MILKENYGYSCNNNDFLSNYHEHKRNKISKIKNNLIANEPTYSFHPEVNKKSKEIDRLNLEFYKKRFQDEIQNERRKIIELNFVSSKDMEKDNMEIHQNQQGPYELLAQSDRTINSFILSWNNKIHLFFFRKFTIK